MGSHDSIAINRDREYPQKGRAKQIGLSFKCEIGLIGFTSNVGGEMRTAESIRTEVEALAQAIEGIETRNDTDALPAIAASFADLRETYRHRPQWIDPYLAELKQLRARFDKIIVQYADIAVDRLFETNNSMKQLEAVREFWREVLIRCARSSRESVEGRLAVAHIKSSIFRSIPPAASASRVELEELVRQAGIWDQSSQLSGPKLQKSIQQTAIPDFLLSRINALFSEATRAQVVCKAKDLH